MYPKIFHIYISVYYIFISFFCYFDLFLPSLSLTKKQNKLKAKLQTYQSVHIHNLQVGIQVNITHLQQINNRDRYMLVHRESQLASQLLFQLGTSLILVFCQNLPTKGFQPLKLLGLLQFLFLFSSFTNFLFRSKMSDT